MSYVNKQHKAKGGPFTNDYLFKMKNTVAIQFISTQGYIQVKGDNLEQVDAKGVKKNINEESQWEVTHLESKGVSTFEIKLKNVKSGKYLRIVDGSVNASGDGGDDCLFIRIYQNNKSELHSGPKEKIKDGSPSLMCINTNKIQTGGGESYSDIHR